MNKKVKLKGRLNMYMRWPVLLSALLLVATVLMYLVDYRAGLLMTACFVLYVAAAIVIYFYLKPSIVDELVNFAIEFAQVQHNLIHDLEIPYAILDETGKLLWANSCMKEIMGEFIDMKNISTLIPDIKQEMLPDDEEENGQQTGIGQNQAQKPAQLLDDRIECRDRSFADTPGVFVVYGRTCRFRQHRRSRQPRCLSLRYDSTNGTPR